MNSKADELFSSDEMVTFALEKCIEHKWLDNNTICLEPSSGDGIFFKTF